VLRLDVQRDVDALRLRLDAIPGEIVAEQAAIAHRYADPTHIPGLRGVDLVAMGGPQEGVLLYLSEHGLRGRTTLGEASFGTIRGLALLYDPDPPRITCIEEIDHGLHPYALDRIVDLLRTASARTQFLIATHSPVLVNRLRANELIVCERDAATGASRMPAIAASEVRAMADAGELALGELWFSGSLGGVPA